VMPFALLQIGLVWGVGPKAFQSGVFNKQWGLLTLQDLHKLYANLVQVLKQKPYGAFYALVTVFGDGHARKIAAKECIVVRRVLGSKTWSVSKKALGSWQSSSSAA
jgi:hypothetical protein